MGRARLGAGAGGRPGSPEGQETTEAAKIKRTGRRNSARREGWGEERKQQRKSKKDSKEIKLKKMEKQEGKGSKCRRNPKS